ncbi:MAG TPA: MAPEG family protein, partial [Steroidobacteraceae bacterium]
EVPVLFYVLVAFLMIMRHADVIFVALAWLFVATRIVHAAIHVTSNTVMRRGPVFGIGVIVLLIMWVIFAVEILTGT